MLGRNTLLASTALVASLALAACADNDNPPAAPLEDPPVAGPLGLVFETPVNVMSADADANTVRVTDDLATVTLNDLTFNGDGDLDTFSITFNLPDGSSVTLTNEDTVSVEDLKDIGDTGVGLRLDTENEDGDLVNIIIGLGLDPFEGEPDDEEIAAEALFALARIDPDGDNPDFGFDTYLVTGAETDTMPAEGEATYSGFTIASVYHHGVLEGDHLRGDVTVTADFEDLEVDIDLEGSGGGNSYMLEGDNLAIDGSDYGGTIDGWINPDGADLLIIPNKSYNAVGDVLGAFFGDDAEATAGVFGATGTDLLNHEVEVIGGFGAYEDEPPS